MSEKRFKGIKVLGKNPNEIFIKDKEKNYYIRTEDEVVDLLNEQQATISQLEKNFDDLTKWASEIAKRNVILDEQIGEQQATIEELRLQEKEKGVPVFVVREGKNPIALFFNEQRASLYCQENMANLTYQQEKWCRVE